MGRTYETLTDAASTWIGRQQMFFVATAPLADDGHVNLSPKGLDTLRILDEVTVAYLDLTGSGAETAAHLRENGRITLMWCAFEGPPRIVRVQGSGEYVGLDDQRIADRFPDTPGARGVVIVHADRISDSCGSAVPLYEFRAERDGLVKWAAARSGDQLDEYRRAKNSTSVDGLPAIDPVATAR